MTAPRLGDTGTRPVSLRRAWEQPDYSPGLLPPAPTPAPRPPAHGFRLLMVGVIGTALAIVVGAAAVTVMHWQPPDWWRLVIVALLCLASDAVILDLRFGRDRISFTLAETAVVVGLALLPVPWLLMLAPAGVAANHLLAGRPALKVAFNAASFAVGIAVAGAILGLLGGAGVPLTSLWPAIALGLAGIGFSLWNGASISAAVALSQRLAWWQVYAEGLPLRVVVAVGNIVVGVAVLALASWQPSTLLVVPPLLLLLMASYRAYLRAMQERDVWQQLEAAAQELSQLAEAEVAAAALRRCAQLFKADSVELLLEADEELPARVYTGSAAGVTSVREQRGAALVDVALLDVTASPGVGGPAEPPQVAPEVRGVPDVLVSVHATLDTPRGRVGLLRLGFEGHVRLSARERQVFTTFAHTVSTSVQNARLYERTRAQAERSAYAASHDALTGLANRIQLQERGAQAIADAAVSGNSCALLLIDLDHFKEINDTLGHAVGDRLLCEVADRLAGAVRTKDLVARLGGDEFAVLLPRLPDPASAESRAAELLRLLSEPLAVDGTRLSVEGSMGIACFPHDGKHIEELLQRVDVALYQAKASRGSYARYRSDRDPSSLDRLALVAELRAGIAAGEVIVHFQPQVELATGRVVGMEALARWQHPQRGLLLPGEFISVAEHSGLIHPFTVAVLDAAVAEAALWRRYGAQISVSVNLSARTLLDRQLPDRVTAILDRHGLPPQLLVFEITETTMVRDVDVAEDVLGRLRSLGVQLSVDDFGTGYSSLAFLQRVAVNEIKVDRSFVSGMLDSDSDAALVRTTVSLARSLGLRVVAEGVETALLRDALTALGCDVGQGWHFGRPAPAELARDRAGVGQPAAMVVSLDRARWS